jgi:hypothetical protein
VASACESWSLSFEMPKFEFEMHKYRARGQSDDSSFFFTNHISSSNCINYST